MRSNDSEICSKRDQHASPLLQNLRGPRGLCPISSLASLPLTWVSVASQGPCQWRMEPSFMRWHPKHPLLAFISHQPPLFPASISYIPVLLFCLVPTESQPPQWDPDLLCIRMITYLTSSSLHFLTCKLGKRITTTTFPVVGF